MSRFNAAAQNARKTTNYEGGEAYTLTPEIELYSVVTTTLLQPTFYESNSNTVLQRIQSLLPKVDPEFAWKLAVYARENMNLRTAPMVLAVELSLAGNGNAKHFARVVQRVDEITESLAYLQQRTGNVRKIPHQMKKGLKLAFGKFDEYQFAKYRGDRKAIKLKDALRIVRPAPTNEAREAIYGRIKEGTLETPYTWEVRLSQAGQNGETKKQVWEELIDSRKVGYMATLRNLRNILEADVSGEHVQKVTEYLMNENAVQNSRQFPFRYLSAYREVRNVASGKVPTVLSSLEEAAKISVSNYAGFDSDTRVLLSTDVSGSMSCPLSERSSVRYRDVGLVLSMLLQNRCKDVVTSVFGTDFKTIQFSQETPLRNADGNYDWGVGWSTNGHLVIDWALRNNREFDKIMIFTDCQLWNSNPWGNSDSLHKLWGRYRARYPNAKLFIFNLAGYGTSPVDVVSGQNTYLISGWNDQVFSMLENLENGKTVVESIRSLW